MIASFPKHKFTPILWIIVGIIFFINPTIGVLTTFIILTASPEGSSEKYYMFFITLALWLGVVNSTKELASDTLAYAEWFENIDTSNFLQSILLYRGEEWGTREILFNFYSVFAYLLLGGNVSAYFMFVSVTIYLLHFISIYCLLKKAKQTKAVIISAIIMTAFFYPTFTQSIHLIRQMLATSLIMYAITYRSVFNKTCWLALISAVFVHVSSLLYVVILLIPHIYKPFKKSYLIFGLLLFIILFSFSTQIGSLLLLTDVDTLAFAGAALTKSSHDFESQLSLRILNIYCIPLLLVCFISLRNKDKNEYMKFPYIYLFVITYIICLSFNFMPVVRVRYFVYVGSFLPYLIVFSVNKINNRIILCCCVAAIFFLMFFFYFGLGKPYASASEIITNSLYHFLIRNPN